MSLRMQPLQYPQRPRPPCRPPFLKATSMWSSVPSSARSTMIGSLPISIRPRGVLWKWPLGD